MPKKTDDLDAAGEQFRAAQDAVTEHRKREVAADLAVMEWHRRHRGLPRQAIYDAKTGDAIHPDLIGLEAQLAKATADTQWCQGLVLACGEVFKGEPLGKILARNEKHRRQIDAKRRGG